MRSAAQTPQHRGCSLEALRLTENLRVQHNHRIGCQHHVSPIRARDRQALSRCIKRRQFARRKIDIVSLDDARRD